MKIRLALVAAFAAAFFGWLFYLGTIMPPKRAMMGYGSNIKEHYEDFGIIPDFNYSLTAEINPGDFTAICKRLKLAPQRSEHSIAGTGLNWGDCPEPWWPDDLALDGAHFRYEPDDEFFALATVRGRNLYYYCVRW